jgi:pimeloyl-ACP methyl ester carboxylesterase
MRAQYKFYSDNFVEVNGVRARYWDVGRGGKILVLIHGFLGSAEEWICNLPELKKNFRVVAFDLPGHGRTSKPKAPYTYEYFASFVRSFFSAMKISSAHVCGHSLGSLVSILFADQSPELVESLILIAPPGGKRINFLHHLLTVPFLGEYLLNRTSSKKDILAACRPLTLQQLPWPEEYLARHLEFVKSPGYVQAALTYNRNYLNLWGLTRKSRKLGRDFETALTVLRKPVLLF